MTEPAREIAITRVYDAPRELVWAAWTEPDQIAGWWGKRGWSTPVDSVVMDVRPGGAFRLNSVSEADGSEMPMEATYREVVAPERLAFADRTGATAAVTFTDLGGGRTEMSFRTTMRAPAELLERAKGGLSSAFDRLAEHLSRSTSPRSPR